MALNQGYRPKLLSSKLEWRNFEMFMSAIFVNSEYCKSNPSLQSWDKFGQVLIVSIGKISLEANMNKFADD